MRGMPPVDPEELGKIDPAGLMVLDTATAKMIRVKGTAGAIAVSATVSPASGALTDRSGTIAGAASQAVAAANLARKYFIFENVSDTDMWLNFGVDAVATQPSFRILANGGSFVMEAGFVSTESVNVICAVVGKAYTAKEA